MADVTAYRPLEHFQKGELMLELKLREGPSWICLNCGYHLDGSGAQPCPDCGKSRYWTRGWSVGRGHRFSAAREEWESRLRTRSRATAPLSRHAAGQDRLARNHSQGTHGSSIDTLAQPRPTPAQRPQRASTGQRLHPPRRTGIPGRSPGAGPRLHAVAEPIHRPRQPSHTRSRTGHLEGIQGRSGRWSAPAFPPGEA